MAVTLVRVLSVLLVGMIFLAVQFRYALLGHNWTKISAPAEFSPSTDDPLSHDSEQSSFR